MLEQNLFSIDFTCPACGANCSVLERSVEIVDSRVTSMEIVGWVEDEVTGDLTEVTDVESETEGCTSRGTDYDPEWVCEQCEEPLPVNSREELCLWLYKEGMLRMQETWSA